MYIIWDAFLINTCKRLKNFGCFPVYLVTCIYQLIVLYSAHTHCGNFPWLQYILMNHLWGCPFPKEVCHIQRDCHQLSYNEQKCCCQGNAQKMKLNHKRHFSQLSSSLLPTMNKFSIYLLIICDYSNVQILYCCRLLYYWFISCLLVKAFYKIEYCGGHDDVPLRPTSRKDLFSPS